MSLVRVDSKSFLEAVSKLPKMKRSPRGGRGAIPNDTIITPGPDGDMFIETPVVGTLVHAGGTWAEHISLDAQLLAEERRPCCCPSKGYQIRVSLRFRFRAACCV